MKQYKTIQFTVESGIGIITLNNPPGNPMSLVFFNELLNLCETHLQNSGLIGLVIDSAGRHFSSGALISQLQEEVLKNGQGTVPAQMQQNARAFQIIRNLNIPAVALLKGICYGSGFELALCAGVRIAAPSTSLCLPEVSFGLMPGLGGVSSLIKICGKARAMELILGGNAIDAGEARQLGIIHKIIQKDHLKQTAVELIKNGLFQC